MTLHEPSRHEALTEATWDADRVRAEIARIADEAHAAFQGEEQLWPIHPLDVSPERPSPLKTVYYGAGGVIWALRRLAAMGLAEPGPDYRPAVQSLLAAHRRDTAASGAAQAGFLTGELGLLLWPGTRTPRVRRPTNWRG